MTQAANDRQTALITGTTSGIGYEFARLFAQNGYNLVLAARNVKILEEQASELRSKYGVAVKTVAQDLSQAKAAQAVYDEVEAAGIKVDVLVNNAGFASYGFFTEIDLTKELEEVQVNVVTLTHLSKLFLPGMVERKHGKILNVASTAAFQPGPLMAVYYASKAYVLSLSEALANEVADKGVTVTALCPGPFESGFQQRADMGESKLVKGRKMPTAAQIAKFGFDAMNKGQTVAIPGLQNRFQTAIIRFLPRKMVTQLVRNAQAHSQH